MKLINTATILALTAGTQASATLLADFDDLALAPSSSENGINMDRAPGGTTNFVQFGSSQFQSKNTFNTQGVSFHNTYTQAWSITVPPSFQYDYWSGFAYSNINDNSTPGFGNQYAAYSIDGQDVSGSGNYGVMYIGSVIDLPSGEKPESIALTNATYSAQSMLNGDGFSQAFSADNDDYFEAVFTGYDALGGEGSQTGMVTAVLADFRSDNAADHFILDDWTSFDLTGLGDAVSIKVSLNQSQGGTPSYLALDNLQLVPEPASLALVAMGTLSVIGRRRRA